MSAEELKICVVDDHKIFRKAMIRLLKTFSRVGEVAEAENGHQCLEYVQNGKPHLVLLDLEMPGMNGIECSERLLQKYPDVKIIILTMHDSDQYMSYLLELGVHSFLLKNTDPEELEKAIYAVCDHDFYHNELIASLLRQKVKAKNKRPHFSKVPLSERELEILRLICLELSLKDIATRLSVSEKTVQTHKLNIQSKLNVKSTVGLVKSAYEMGLFDEGGLIP
jgi:Response regulator containing a CheY-like receiver domain and an HTH DNA-binding domain